MTKTFPRTLQAFFTSLLFGLCFTPLVSAQVPYSSPYPQRAANREARWAYLASQRAKASIPVNYTFAVRPDLATAYSAAAYSPRYQYSSYGQLYANYPQAGPAGTYQNAARTAYRPVPAPYTTYANPRAADTQTQPVCSPVTQASNPYYSGTVTPARRANDAYYVGSSLSGPPKVYPTDQPIRNVFRYLLP